MSEVQGLRLKNINKIVIGHRNLNSISPKFDQLKKLVLKHANVLLASETKFDDTFYDSQFYIDGFCMPCRLDKIRNGGSVSIFVKEGIPRKVVTKHNFPSLLNFYLLN